MLKIPVCYSFDSEILSEFQKEPYLPVGCGGYFSENINFFDDTGDNISKYNKYVNELTLIYWVAMNYDMIGNPEFIGFAHYRRYLDFNINDVKDNNIICSFEDQSMPLYQMYCMYHVKSDLDLFLSVFANQFPFYQQTLTDYFNQCRHAKCNMFIMGKNMFFDYFSFMKPCISLCIEGMLPLLNLDTRDRYQMRALGFILERMTGFWIYLKQLEGGINAVNVGIIEKNISSIYSRV